MILFLLLEHSACLVGWIYFFWIVGFYLVFKIAVFICDYLLFNRLEMAAMQRYHYLYL